jgi:hypothetical protein
MVSSRRLITTTGHQTITYHLANSAKCHMSYSSRLKLQRSRPPDVARQKFTPDSNFKKGTVAGIVLIECALLKWLAIAILS